MSNEKRSCYKCEERHPGCHATCERFEKDDEALKIRKAKEKAYNLVEGYVNKAKHDSKDEKAKKRIRDSRYARKPNQGK